MNMEKIVFVFLLLLSNFYGITNISSLILFFVMVLVSYKYINFRESFTKPFLFFFTLYFLSFIPAYWIRHQSPLESLVVSYPYLSIMFFFVLKANKFDERQSEKILGYMAITTSCVYVLQFIMIKYGINFLGISEMRMEQGYDTRFRIACSGIFSLGFFFYFNRYVVLGGIKNIICLSLCIIPIIIQAFRMQWVMIITGILIILYYVNKGSRLKMFRYVFPIFLTVIVVSQIPLVQGKFNDMMERQQNENFDNADYARVITLNYLQNEHVKSPVEYILGSGPANPSSSYGKELLFLEEQGIFFADLGLYGLSFLIGPITVIVLLWLALRNVFLRKDKRYVYVMAWYIFMVSISFTNSEFFRIGNFLIHGLALYIAYLRYNKLELNK